MDYTAARSGAGDGSSVRARRTATDRTGRATRAGRTTDGPTQRQPTTNYVGSLALRGERAAASAAAAACVGPFETSTSSSPWWSSELR